MELNLEITASIAQQLSSILGEYPFFDIALVGNTIGEYIIFLILFLLLFSILRVFRMVVLNRIKNIIKKIDKKQIGETFVSIIDTIRPSFYYFLAFYISIHALNVHNLILKILTGILIAWLGYQAVRAIQILIDYAIEKYLIKEKDQGTQHAILTIGKIAKWALWIFAAIFVFANLGVNVTSAIAGLGIGGIAIALALQNILNDLFSSFAIYFDKPFIVGDFIIAGEHMGIVEKIGIKTTRLRALQGEEIVISNRELTSARIQNFKKMTKRRIVFKIGVTYETSLEKLKKIPSFIEEIIKEEKLAELDRVHFAEFGDFSLNFEIVYYILSGVYKDYMDTQQNMLFKIKEKFESENISMAFPTQTIYLEKENGN